MLFKQIGIYFQSELFQLVLFTCYLERKGCLNVSPPFYFDIFFSFENTLYNLLQSTLNSFSQLFYILIFLTLVFESTVMVISGIGPK